MTVHELKILPEYYIQVLMHKKLFELRKNDRNFKTGDILLLKEWSPLDGYSGNCLTKKIVYILENCTGLENGFVILSIV